MTHVNGASARSAASSSSRLLAVVAPLLVVGLASVLWLISDRLLYIGPLDRATFGWSVVVPIWAAAPLVAGFAWLRLSPRARMLAAVTCGLVVGGAVTVLLWQDVAFPDCQYGPVRGPIEWLLPAITLGTVIGGGFGLSGLIASTQVRAGHPWLALVFGAATQVGVGFVAIALAFVLSAGGICLRP